MGVETSASHANEMENPKKGLSISNVLFGHSGHHFRHFWRIDCGYSPLNRVCLLIQE